MVFFNLKSQMTAMAVVRYLQTQYYLPTMIICGLNFNMAATTVVCYLQSHKIGIDKKLLLTGSWFWWPHQSFHTQWVHWTHNWLHAMIFLCTKFQYGRHGRHDRRSLLPLLTKFQYGRHGQCPWPITLGLSQKNYYTWEIWLLHPWSSFYIKWFN